MNTFAGKAGATNLSRRPRAFAVAALAFLGCAICSCTTYPHSSLVEKWWKKYPPVYDPDDPDWEKKPPKLQEIAPPHFSTPTVIALQSSPSTRGPSRRLFAERYDPAEASEEGLRRLHDCQELLLRHSDSLLAKASRHLALWLWNPKRLRPTFRNRPPSDGSESARRPTGRLCNGC